MTKLTRYLLVALAASIVLAVAVTIWVRYPALATVAGSAPIVTIRATPTPWMPRNEVEYRIVIQDYDAKLDCNRFAVTYIVISGTSQKDTGTCRSTEKVRPLVVHQFQAPRGMFLYLSAQNQGASGNRAVFACEIRINGRRVAHVESTGFAKIASCEFSLP